MSGKSQMFDENSSGGSSPIPSQIRDGEEVTPSQERERAEGETSESPSMGDQSEERKLSFGEKAVGITFNPGGNNKVNEVKALYGQIIDLLNDFRPEEDQDMTGDQARLLKIAITEAQGAQMWAVKGITCRY